MSWGLGGGAGLSVLKLVLGVYLLLTGLKGWAQSTSEVHGHVFHEEGYAPCSDALIQAWPCGHSFPVSPEGRFDVNCPEGVDSLTVLAHGHRVVTVAVEGRTHIDVELASLAVSLEQAEVDGRTSEDLAEARDIVDSGPLLETLDRVPGVRGLDLGAGMIQPVLRGLVGSRVAVLEDGVPQAGGRWGADHGVLLDPALYDGMQWVPGGGHVWLGPDAMGGGLRMQALRMLGAEGNRLQFGSAQRMGDGRTKVHALYRQRQGEFQWHFGLSVQRFGDRNVPQSTFRYLGRQFDLPEGRLPNTGGRGLHGIAGFRWSDPVKGRFGLDFRWSEVLQGLFPGIVGIPSQSDLAPDGDRFNLELPRQRASRVLATLKWTRLPAGRQEFRSHTASLSWNRRLELAPPHAHGWGPEPTSPISLELQEWTAFAEGLRKDAHGQRGWQVEALALQATGWEFLVPDHRRLRASSWWSNGTWSARFDGVVAAQNAHAEPLYNAEGTVIGTDVRSAARTWWLPGGALAYEHPFTWSELTTGQVTLSASTRAPSNYEWGAYGIHHGTFRFEQGHPDLKPEQTLEGRFSLNARGDNNALHIQVQGFAALHRHFIHLAPSAAFAPVVHAGQVYTFRAVNAFRTGAEASLSWQDGRSRWTLDAAALGQWELATGLGLPFTTPMQARAGWERASPAQKWSVAAGVKGVAPAWIVARNEAETPGTVLFDARVAWNGRHGVWSINGQNLFNTAWLDHISSYRALGMVAQGRWLTLSYRMNINHLSTQFK